jgi:RNA polymerase sigma-70 factor (ECF subfamily)
MGLIRCYVRDEQAAQDLSQDILLNIHRARHTYDPSRPFRPWLSSISRHAIYDHLRRKRRVLKTEVLASDFYVASASESGCDDLKILRHAISRLPEAQRTAVELLKLKGLSMEDAARAQNISVSAMKVRSHRGYLALQKILLTIAEDFFNGSLYE